MVVLEVLTESFSILSSSSSTLRGISTSLSSSTYRDCTIIEVCLPFMTLQLDILRTLLTGTVSEAEVFYS